MPTQTEAQKKAAYQGAGLTSLGQPVVPTTISSASLTPTPTSTMPPVTPIDTGNSTNASVPFVPAKTPEQIVNDANAPTAAEGQQSSLLNDVSNIIGGRQSLATLQTNAENTAGVSGLLKTNNDIALQLQGLSDQSTLLQNDAAVGGSIDNASQESAVGRGITAAGLAPITASALRQNQIKQSAISSQALTVKAAYYAANNNYVMAKDAADKAAQVQFDAVQQQIDYKQAQLNAIKPQLDKEQAARAQLLQVQLDQAKTDAANQREDFQTGQAMAITALKLNPNDPQAQYAAQQALKLDPKDPNYIQKVLALTAKYQSDPIATASQALQLKIQQEQYKQLIAAPDVKTTQHVWPDGSISLIDDSGNVLKTIQPPAGLSGSQLAPALQAEVDKQNALDAQTVSGAFDTVKGILSQNGVPDLSKITETDVAKLSDIQIESLAKALARMQNPDIARQGGDAGNALAPQSFAEKGQQFFLKAFGGKNYLPQKVVDAVKNSVELQQSRGLPSLAKQSTSSGSPATGTDGAAYGHPGYVSDGTQWVAK